MCTFEDGLKMWFLIMLLGMPTIYLIFCGIGKWITGGFNQKLGAIAVTIIFAVFSYREIQVKHIGHALIYVPLVVITGAYFIYLWNKKDDKEDER